MGEELGEVVCSAGEEVMFSLCEKPWLIQSKPFMASWLDERSPKVSRSDNRLLVTDCVGTYPRGHRLLKFLNSHAFSLIHVIVIA